MNWARALDLACRALLALTGALLFPIGLLLMASQFLSMAPPPCEIDEVRSYAMLLLGLACLTAPSAMAVLTRLSPMRQLLGALAIPALCLGAYEAAAARGDRGQAACRNRPLPEAMVRCGANPDHYRLSKTPDGYATLTLMAPGTDDAAFRCLQDWARRANKAPSIEIDESVYAAYRARR